MKMKSRGDVRRYLSDLTLMSRVPCSCAGTEHEAECRRGGDIVEGVLRALRWVLGENPKHDLVVEEMARRAAEVRRAMLRHDENKL